MFETKEADYECEEESEGEENEGINIRARNKHTQAHYKLTCRASMDPTNTPFTISVMPRAIVKESKSADELPTRLGF